MEHLLFVQLLPLDHLLVAPLSFPKWFIDARQAEKKDPPPNYICKVLPLKMHHSCSFD